MERRANEYFKKIEEIGGVMAGIEKGFFMKEIADAAYQFQQKLDSGERIFVGLIGFVEEAPNSQIDILKIGLEYENRQRERLAKLRARRDNKRVEITLNQLKEGIKAGHNSFPLLLDAVKSYATIGEISDALREVWGAYREPAVF
jgi:methylmalonyl-CoA mutase N-terminal domain/subunit